MCALLLQMPTVSQEISSQLHTGRGWKPQGLPLSVPRPYKPQGGAIIVSLVLLILCLPPGYGGGTEAPPHVLGLPSRARAVDARTGMPCVSSPGSLVSTFMMSHLCAHRFDMVQMKLCVCGKSLGLPTLGTDSRSQPLFGLLLFPGTSHPQALPICLFI